MLQTFRKQSDKWFTKALFGAIIASFMVWGIGDIIRNLNHDGTVVTVGPQKVPYESYVELFQREISRLQQIIKKKITPAQIQEIGLHQRVLDQLINDAALEQEIQHSQIYLSDNALKRAIHSMAIFQENNKFSPTLLNNLLRHNKVNEKDFIKIMRNSLLQQQLFSPMENAMPLPGFYQNLLFEILHQKRVFAVGFFPWEKIKLKRSPTAEEINTYYEKQKDNYRNPERRNIRLVIIKSQDLLAKIAVSEAEIQQEYQNKAAQFIKPEKRGVISLTYSSEEQARAAEKLAMRGDSLEKVAKMIPGGSYQNLGCEEKTAFAEIVANNSFGLDLNKTSQVINSGFGYVLYQVVKIEPAILLPLREVKSKIVNNLQIEKFGDGLQKLKNTLEDSLADGIALEEIANSQKLKIESITNLDRNGKAEDGKPAMPSFNAVAREKILEQAFTLGQNLTSSVFELNEQDLAIVHVDKIADSYIPALGEIRAAVEGDIIRSKKYEEGYALIETLCNSIQSESDLARLGQQQGLIIKDKFVLSSADWIGDDTATQEKLKPYSQELISKALQTPLSQSIFGLSRDNKFFVILIPIKKDPFKVDPKKKQNFEKLIRDSAPDGLRELFIKSLRGKFSVKINQPLLDKIVA